MSAAKREPSLRERALRFLARREHTRAELARRLGPHVEDAAQLEALLDELQRRKLLSDARYAEARVHTLSRKYGAARIERDLRARGVSKDLAGEAARRAAGTELERARTIWQRKFGSLPRNLHQHAAQARFMLARGFSMDVVKRILEGRED